MPGIAAIGPTRFLLSVFVLHEQRGTTRWDMAGLKSRL